MGLATRLETRLDDYGKPAWIGIMVLGFIVFWPVGLAILAYMIWSGRMGCWGKRGPGRWYHEGNHRSNPGSGAWRGGKSHAQSSGNRAFDEYREETLRRLEEEQAEFLAFLERLRHAKDKAEFDQFMAEQRQRPAGPGEANDTGGPAPA